jgi:hypothetical protein
MNCDEGLLFNPTNNWCDYPYDAMCKPYLGMGFGILEIDINKSN